MKKTIILFCLCMVASLVSCSLESTPAANCPAGDGSGDCRVDLADLTILADYWLGGSIVPGVAMEGCWQMDLMSGSATVDASGNDRALSLLNGASLQTDDERGSVLSLDGYNDYGLAPFVVNPADGPMSVFAWIKGGADRQVIISQADGEGYGREWLQIDTSGGKLISRLTDGNTILRSDAVVADGAWHHVGAVWDGQQRYLYVDGVEVARDETALTENLQACDGDIRIGAGKNLNFWGGTIDDVRIYSRAVDAGEIALMGAQPETPPYSADLNGDRRVDMKDFVVLANDWLWDYSGEYRCIWVDSWNRGIRDASECDELIQTCRDANINTVIVEIRKVGDAYYNSSLEPRATNISASFDPLGYLISKAHDTSGGKKYVEVHGWFVAQRIATSSSLHPDHVLSRHPEYVMLNSDGQPSSGNTTRFLDPGHPGALDHNVAVILDCLSKYDIDGINLDYIRYPEYTGDWGYNPVSVARFNAFYGKSGQPSPSDPDWSDWRRECVTQQVRKIYVKSLMIDPGVIVTADTIAWGSGFSNFAASRAYTEVFQDWVGWLRAGIVDYNTLMAYYQYNDPRYPGWHEGWCKLSLANDEKRGSILCTAAYKQLAVQDAVDQLLDERSWGAEGLNIYDWHSEMNANTSGETRTDFYRELRQQVYPEWVDPPVHPWKARPATGIFEGNLTASGSPIDHGTVEIDGLPATRVYTDGSGWYAILDVEPGDHTLRFAKPGYPVQLVPVVMPAAGRIITVDSDFQ